MDATNGNGSPAVDTPITGDQPGATTPNPTVPGTTPAPPAPPAAAETPKHDPWLVRQLLETGRFSQADIDAVAPTELPKLVYLMSKGLPAHQPQYVPPAPAPAPVPDKPKYQLPAEVRSKLGELDSSIVEAIELVGAKASRSDELEAEINRLKAQQQTAAFEQTVHLEMNKYPALGQSVPPAGTPEFFKRQAVINHLGMLERNGQLQGIPPAVAIQMAANLLFGATQASGAASPPPPSAPPPVTPSPSIRPTNRLAKDDETSLVELWRRAFDEQEAEAAAAGKTNGVWRP